MTKRYLLSSLAVLLTVMSVQAQVGKQITSILCECHQPGGDSEESTFTYDASGRPIAAHTVSTNGAEGDKMDYASTFSYDDAAQTISSHTVISSDGEQNVMDAVATLSSGRVSKVVFTEMEHQGTMAGSILEVSYDDDGHVVNTKNKLTTLGEEYVYAESVISWQDGNIVSVSSTGNGGSLHNGVQTLRYDMSKPAPKNPYLAYVLMDMPFDLSSMQMLLPMLPYMGYSSRNLPVGWEDERKEVSYAYEYDSDGDIRRIEVFSSQEKTHTYTFGLGTSGISDVRADQPGDDCYSLQGHKVNHPTKGIYVRGGRKVVVR